MIGMDRLTDETLEKLASDFGPNSNIGDMARELLAHRRASQAASGGCGYPCGYDCNGACFQASTAPSDELAEIDAMLMDGQGDDDGPQILPDFEPGWSVAAKVEACLHLLEKRRDVIAAPAPSDGLREAARYRTLRQWFIDSRPRSDIAPHGHIIFTTLEMVDQWCDEQAALSASPAQEGGE